MCIVVMFREDAVLDSQDPVFLPVLRNSIYHGWLFFVLFLLELNFYLKNPCFGPQSSRACLVLCLFHQSVCLVLKVL